jgi:hypothetical protein
MTFPCQFLAQPVCRQAVASMRHAPVVQPGSDSDWPRFDVMYSIDSSTCYRRADCNAAPLGSARNGAGRSRPAT